MATVGYCAIVSPRLGQPSSAWTLVGTFPCPVKAPWVFGGGFMINGPLALQTGFLLLPALLFHAPGCSLQSTGALLGG